jgi:hypothetical protein
LFILPPKICLCCRCLLSSWSWLKSLLGVSITICFALKWLKLYVGVYSLHYIFFISTPSNKQMYSFEPKRKISTSHNVLGLLLLLPSPFPS